MGFQKKIIYNAIAISFACLLISNIANAWTYNTTVKCWQEEHAASSFDYTDKALTYENGYIVIPGYALVAWYYNTFPAGLEKTDIFEVQGGAFGWEENYNFGTAEPLVIDASGNGTASGSDIPEGAQNEAWTYTSWESASNYVCDSCSQYIFMCGVGTSLTGKAHISKVNYRLTVNDDAYENNDTMASARTVVISSNTLLSSIGGKGICKDDDWYKISIGSGVHKSIILYSQYQYGNIDVRIYDSSGNQIDYSTTQQDTETLFFKNPGASAYYYLKVYYADHGDNSYDIRFVDSPYIDGYVRTAGTNVAISGTSVAASGEGESTTTDSNGYYKIYVPYNWSGTVAVLKDDYEFTPSYKAYTNVISNKTGQNFTGVAPTGSLKISISPQAAIEAGAQWRRINTSTWKDSGSTETGIPVGGYEVEFRSITGWTNPANKTGTIIKDQLSSNSGSYTQQVGALKISISPQGAIDAGAEWRRVNTSTWRASGYTESNVPVGGYEVEFKSIAGWTTPSNKTGTVLNGQLSTNSGSYVQQKGSLKVSIFPESAVNKGAQWRRVGTSTWRDSESTEIDILVGGYDVEFKTIAGWTSPTAKNVTIVNGQTASTSGTYTQQYGSIRTSIYPQEAVDAGAQWRRVGEAAWLNSNSTETFVPVDQYSIEFKSITGWAAPQSQNVTVLQGQTATASGTYTQAFGSVQVTISPQGAIDAGAQWRRVGTSTWRNSGATESNVPVGSHSVEFKPVTGWSTPSNQNITVTQNQTATASGAYAQSTTVKISGFVLNASAEPIIGVNVMLSGSASGSAVTDASGYYAFDVLPGNSVTITPSKETCTFAPPSRSYISIIADASNQNYVVTCLASNASAHIDIDHTYRGDLRIWIGVGSTKTPLWSKLVLNHEGGSADDVVMDVDISEASQYLPPNAKHKWFINVRDDSNGDEGSIKKFSIDCNGRTYSAKHLPEPVLDNTNSYAYIGSISLPWLHLLFENQKRIVPDTGITKCYDNDGEIPCPQPGQDFYGQDAQYRPSATQPSYTNNGDGTVTDNVTGLMWMQADDGVTRTWQDAITYCDGLSHAGHSDWRLPERRELFGIVDFSRTSPAINPVFTSFSSTYWSNSPYVDSAYAWVVYFYDGFAGFANKEDPSWVRCVRSGP